MTKSDVIEIKDIPGRSQSETQQVSCFTGDEVLANVKLLKSELSLKESRCSSKWYLFKFDKNVCKD